MEVRSIRREEVQERLQGRHVDNESRDEGTALVNVLPPESFGKEHIPGSVNIPQGREEEFERRYDKGKEIIVYCASPDCPASPTVAEDLRRRGFTDVWDYDAGMSGWKEAGNEVSTGAEGERTAP